MRADVCTLVTLDTVINLPLGNIHCDTALLVSSRTVVPRTVLTTEERTYGQQVALQSVDRIDDLLYELGTRRINHSLRSLNLDCSPLSGNLNLLNSRTTGINCCVVHIDDILALLAVRLLNSLLHLFNRLLERNHVCDLEECTLHNGVGAVAQTQLSSDLGCVDDIEVNVVLSQINLHCVGQRCASGCSVVHRVQKERTALLQALQNVILIDIRRNVASHEIGRSYQIGRSDRVVAKTQVRRGVTARLLRVIREVCLAILVGRATDDLDRVLVGTNRTVSTQTEEQCLERTLLSQRDLLTYGQRSERNVINDTYGELILRLGSSQILINCQHLCGGCILRRQTVATTDDHRTRLAVVECVLNIEVERLACCARLLGAVEYADTLHALGHHVEHILRREGTIEVNGDNTHLLALLVEVINNLLQGLGNRTHRYNNLLSVLSTVVGEGLVLTTGDLRDLLHRVGNHIGDCDVETVCSLTGLEIDIGVLSRTAGYGVLGIECACAELSQSLTIEQRSQTSLVDEFDLLNLVRGAETIEEVQERHTRLDSHDVSHTSQVHNLLNRRCCQHCEAGLAGRHHVLMVAEDRQRLGRQCASRNVEYTRQQLTGDFVHIGDHQQ